VVTFLSDPKNSFPSTRIFATSSPSALIFPLTSTSIPGIFLSRSSTTASGFVTKALALNSTVSLRNLIGTYSATTFTSPTLTQSKLVLPISIPESSGIVIFLYDVTAPTNDTCII